MDYFLFKFSGVQFHYTMSHFLKFHFYYDICEFYPIFTVSVRILLRDFGTFSLFSQ